MSSTLKPTELYLLLVNAITATDSRLVVQNKDEGVSKKLCLAKLEKAGKPIFFFNVEILYDDNDLSKLVFHPARPEDSEKLTNAVAAVVRAISEYRRYRGLRS